MSYTLICIGNISGEHLPYNFPYGYSEKTIRCASDGSYATPESMLGSWAMRMAVNFDVEHRNLPQYMSKKDVMYAVGTVALGNALKLNNCANGCNRLNGFCFAMHLPATNKDSPHYIVIQSVNIDAMKNTVDVYMAGGGSGKFPQYCKKFWGSKDVNWAQHIQNLPSCEVYFHHFSNFDAKYITTYNGNIYPAKETLINACRVAWKSGVSRKNWHNVPVVPVTCPGSLMKISGLQLRSEGKVGYMKTISLPLLKKNDFKDHAIYAHMVTQMQDCKNPSSGYYQNVKNALPDYDSSISATLFRACRRLKSVNE